MAKRRKLTAPSAEDLSRLEEEFRRETSPSPMAPIAQVAAEAAREAPVSDPEIRASQARDSADAQTLRDAEAAGLLIREIPVEEIAAEDMVRDRAQITREEMQELELSIELNGLRLPIEVYELSETDGGPERYGIISGYRRYKAVSGMYERWNDPRHAKIKAIVREPGSLEKAFASMVEENEIRVNLSPFERGRIVSLAVQMGVFPSTQVAVDRMFAMASKAKRSKIRSFAVIFEELGDLLNFPEALSEKQGLRLSAALRGGADRTLRDTLGEAAPADSADEWDVLEPIVAAFEDNARDERRGGRPSRKGRAVGSPGREVKTSTGFTIRRDADEKGFMIRVGGRQVDSLLMDDLVREVQRLLDKPK
ncbi:ParB/RepB/Spo0J family partition protein [Pacificoceanicola onchidii]|uniref:ParB/RepB/Spo0J family partition protein n=1 Tax=Pacificoceanicola onchidii TaxID=2562685 RepID=UPI0010A5A99F|nr:ParB N-terminal domain-containing protein [Pacificoceanicola onchidii]